MKKQIALIAVTLGLFSVGAPVASHNFSPVATAAAKTTEVVPGSQIKLAGAVNVRDLGGYKTESGKVIKPNMLIRSAKLNTLTSNDEAILTKEHHVAVDVDLRTPAEMKEAPDKRMSGVKYIANPVVSDAESKENDKIANGQTGMIDYYKYFVDSTQGRHAYKVLFHELLTVPSNKAVRWHCSAGKDRAGFGTALIMTALGVNKSTIYKDYLLSNKYRKQTNDQALAELRKKGASKATIKKNYYGLIVEKAYLDEAYKEAETHYGSMKGFLEKGLGLTQADLTKLQNKYLEK
ncbi:tyrosine-protein phosphatase [Lentilactobacillus kefiri]|uniref:Protein-tyrosine-phosphatase n=1 Tax=Lentilactobacillus kefiri TaxID=33962 RepID=A0A511DY61_LENKE|nr:tyrosine-protein phosphatase [Lentilactobacillus kefiri]MCJ2162550.1 tyrosine-protein phosphatase [Lentilactobacillus kefiri]MDM7493598.1 tyrosine-protein phosphatase [Lentilactobacillus kefiri]UOD78671.1 tyrosine-protein phosphatase [Lentilactobacillus kefiri]GEL29063.1 protein-tyrosine-phosphatase [Lentilactobacillus kefiri]